MPIIKVNDIHLYYEDHGTGTPLVLMHGFSSTGAAWDQFLQIFSTKYRLIVPDFRGHGRSTGTLETIHHHNFALDLIALLDALQIDKAHFVGHSSGGMCLLFLARDHPERAISLSLVSATYTFDAHARPLMLQVAEGMDNPENIARSRQMHGETHGSDCWKIHREAFRNFAQNPLELPFTPADLEQISLPVFVLHGDRDSFFPIHIPMTMYQSFSNAQLCILPKTGHGLPSEQPKRFADLIMNFLESAD